MSPLGTQWLRTQAVTNSKPHHGGRKNGMSLQKFWEEKYCSTFCSISKENWKQMTGRIMWNKNNKLIMNLQIEKNLITGLKTTMVKGTWTHSTSSFLLTSLIEQTVYIHWAARTEKFISCSVISSPSVSVLLSWLPCVLVHLGCYNKIP